MNYLSHSLFLLSDGGAVGLFAGALLTFVFIILAIILIPAILYLVSLQNTLKEVSLENRKTDPGMVWLMLIPVFNLVWHFILLGYISDSLKAEMKKRNIPQTEEKPAYTIGLIAGILWCCGFIPVLGILAGLAAFICWIVYWVKIVEYKNILLRNPIKNDATQA